MAFRDQRGQPERRKNKKKRRKSNLSTPCLIFIQTQALPLRPRPSLFSLPLLSFLSQSAPSITYSLSLLPHITAHLLSSSASPTVSITAREKNSPEMVPPSRKYQQLEGRSILKHVEGLLLNGFLAPCSGTFNRPQRSGLHLDIYPQQMRVTPKNFSGKRQRLASVRENGEDFWWQLPFEEPFNGEQREIHHLLLQKSQQRVL